MTRIGLIVTMWYSNDDLCEVSDPLLQTTEMALTGQPEEKSSRLIPSWGDVVQQFTPDLLAIKLTQCPLEV